jgi:hypothetical protein
MINEVLPQDFFVDRANDASVLGANKDFHQDFADGQVPGVNSLGGQGSCNQGPGSWINQANAGVHPPPSNIGHVPSHVSIGSNRTQATSVGATSRYFGSTHQTPTEINPRWVTCPKTAHGVHGSCNYSCHQVAVTRALPHIFAMAKHFHAKNSEGKALNKYANLQSEYAGNLAIAKIKNFKRHMDAWDMSDPFVIPQLIDPYALLVKDHWAERKTTGIHLLKNWGKLILHQCCNWKHDSFDYASTNNLTSMEWARAPMMNSCDALLVKRINKKFKDLDLYKQDGVTYI